MRVAHIIMAHKGPDQLEALIRSLDHPMFDVYLHVDAKINLNDFKSLKTLKNLTFIKKRHKCNWGGYSLLKAEINCMDEVLKSCKGYDYINLLSGQDYPMYSSDNIYNFLKANAGKIFLSYDDSNPSLWWKHAIGRFERYHLTDFNFPGRYFLQSLLNKITPRRKFPGGMTLYGGNNASWWTITGKSAQYVIDIIANDKNLDNFLRFCWGTDEFVIPTLIMNSSFRSQVVNNNLRYIDWSEGNPNPKILMEEDLEKIIGSQMLFARKFDFNADVSVIDKIEQYKSPE